MLPASRSAIPHWRADFECDLFLLPIPARRDQAFSLKHHEPARFRQFVLIRHETSISIPAHSVKECRASRRRSFPSRPGVPLYVPALAAPLAAYAVEKALRARVEKRA